MAPLIVCNIGWMSRYEGLSGKPDKVVGHFKYIKDNERANEVCNFIRCRDGYVYGHVETWKGEGKKQIDRQIKIENLNSAAASDDKIVGVDVVWTAPNLDEGGRRVVGWYRNATIFRERQYFDRYPSAQHRRDGVESYRVRAKSKDVFLILLEKRNLKLKGRKKGWMGEAEWWFPESKPQKDIQGFVAKLRQLMSSPADIGSTKSIRTASRPKGKWGGIVDPERKVKVEHAAMQAVKKHYRNLEIEDVTKDNVGWDFEVRLPGGTILCLEVKGLSGSELKVGLTPNEYRVLKSHVTGEKPNYGLCVVTTALSNPRLQIFRYDEKAESWLDDVSEKGVSLKVDQLQAAIISLV